MTPPVAKPSPKSEETRTRILEAALAIFRERGFERATMREIAAQAGMAVGAAYYYFDSKEAIVLAFYDRSQSELLPMIESRLAACSILKERLHAIVSSKFEYFLPNRALLGALSAHTDPRHPLSPFAQQTASIREADIALFERAVTESAVKLPRRIAPYLPRLLWLYQMGLVLFWVYDESPDRQKTAALFEKSLAIILLVLRVANLPLLQPIHRLTADLLESVYGNSTV
jgi:AcrR family transcriptional regulator